MTNSTRQFIDNLTEKIISLYEIQIPIQRIDDVVQKIGGSIIEQEDFDKNYDGSIKKTSDEKFQIAISKNQSFERRNFTIAHELGHLFLHMGYKTNIDLWKKQDNVIYKRFGNSEQEYQANEFAASFLMPEKMYIDYFRNIYSGNFDVDIKSVSDNFKVSIQAAINRGKFLGYI